MFPNTELLPAITATGAPNRPITFRKTGDGANPILQVQGTTATTDAAIKLMGGDYFTFERIDIQNYPSLSSLEYGFQLAAQSYNPCSHNSISYCSITLSRSNSATKAILSAGATSAGNSNNSYLNLGIADCNTGIYLIGNGTAAYHNDGELVSNCVLTDISGQGIEINYSTSVRVTLNQISMCANNNIFMNTSTPGNAGITAALWKSVDGFANINAATDNNIWYAGTPGPRNLICRTPSVYYETLDDYKAAAESFDQSSFTESVPFVDGVGPDYDIHIPIGAATIAESNATPIDSIVTDIDLETRNASTPDIGADEGNFVVPANAPAPAVVVSPQMNEYAVSINPSLTWYASGAGGAPTGYLVYFWSNNPPSDIADVIDIGNVLSCFSPVTLNYLSTYYWKIVPYNDNGSTDPDDCPVWQFSTHQVPLTGNWVIGSSGFYPDFTHAIRYLNASGVGTGGVTFKALATEVFAENPPPPCGFRHSSRPHRVYQH